MKNMNIRIIAIILLLLTVDNYARGQKIPEDPMLRKGKLSNGLTYYIRYNERQKGKADFYIAQKVGSVLEEENQRGLAHFLEHMAFNGTKNFPGNTIINELEEKGIKFGININASTSYDQTVYQLSDIPVSKGHQGMLDTALLILHDWSGFISIAEPGIEKERKIVHEEWRTRSTGELRALENGVFPVIYAGTPYANRIPIGSMAVIDNFKREELQAYYHKWYRPDLQAIIVVGDVNVAEVEARLIKIFKDIPAPEKPSERPEFQIPDNTDPIVAIAKDAELKGVSMKVFWKFNDDAKAQKQGFSAYKTTFLQTAISNILLNRFYEIGKKTDQAFNRANVSVGNFLIANNKKALSLNIIPVDPDSSLSALNSGLIEVERLHRFGFTSVELENCKRNGFRLLEMEYKDRNNRENFEYVREYVTNFTKNDPVPDAEWRYQTGSSVLKDLSLDTLNFYARKLITDNNMVFVVIGQDNEGVKLPDKEEILSVWNRVKQTKLVPYISDVKINMLDKVHPVPGKLMKTEKKPFGYVQWTFKNGVKVWFKQTTYKENAFLIHGYSPGGLSSVSMNDLPSALALNSTINQGDIIDRESGAVVAVKLNKFDEEVRGETSNLNHLENLFKLIYLRMTSINKQPLVFNQFIKEKRNEIKNRSANPKIVFEDTLTSIMNNHHPRSISINDPEILAKVDEDRMIKVFKERIGNASGFTFFLTGNADPDRVLNWTKTYLGNIPYAKNKEKMRNYGLISPQGLVKKHFTAKMQTPQTTVTIGYTGKIPYTVENIILMDYLSSILKLNYTTRMRMQEGGTYEVEVSGDLYKFPNERFVFQAYFDTDPAKKEKLISIFYQEIEKMIKNGPDQKNLDKVRENLLKSYRAQPAEQNAGYWESKARMFYVYGINQDTSAYRKMVLSITIEKIREFAKRLFNQGNLIEVVMDPEK